MFIIESVVFISGADSSLMSQITSMRADEIICDYQQLLNMSDNDLQLLTKDDLIQRIIGLRQRHLFTTQSPLKITNNNNNNNQQRQQEDLNTQQILRELLIQSRNQTQLLDNINRTLTNLAHPTTIVKFSLVALFLWTIPNFKKVQKSFWS